MIRHQFLLGFKMNYNQNVYKTVAYNTDIIQYRDNTPPHILNFVTENIYNDWTNKLASAGDVDAIHTIIFGSSAMFGGIKRDKDEEDALFIPCDTIFNGVFKVVLPKITPAIRRWIDTKVPNLKEIHYTAPYEYSGADVPPNTTIFLTYNRINVQFTPFHMNKSCPIITDGGRGHGTKYAHICYSLDEAHDFIMTNPSITHLVLSLDLIRDNIEYSGFEAAARSELYKNVTHLTFLGRIPLEDEAWESVQFVRTNNESLNRLIQEFNVFDHGSMLRYLATLFGGVTHLATNDVLLAKTFGHYVIGCRYVEYTTYMWKFLHEGFIYNKYATHINILCATDAPPSDPDERNAILDLVKRCNPSLVRDPVFVYEPEVAIKNF